MQSKILDYISQDNHSKWIIDPSYSPYAKNHLTTILKNWIDDQAVRRVYEEWISIDWIESKDLDDAIWLEKTKSWYCLFVHISDVTEAIQPYSPLDLEALKRTTSIYRKDGIINMFPEDLSYDLLSLNENWTKLTLTTKIELDDNWNIINTSVYESIFKNKLRCDYDMFCDYYLDPDSEYHTSFQLMYELARKRRHLRKSSWASLDFDESDRHLSIWDKVSHKNEKFKQIPKIVIEEFMILANIASAGICIKNKYNSIFRLHDWEWQRAYYHAQSGLHSGLALREYSHFTSPIRRYSDIIIHRVLKLVHLRWEKEPYTSREIQDISSYINFSREIIDTLWREYDSEIKGRILVEKIKSSWDWETKVSDFTKQIRWDLSCGRRISSTVEKEIIRNLEDWEKWDFAWWIGVFLVWKNQKIKDVLKKVLLDERIFKPKAIISILNNTKIISTDESSLFDIYLEEEGNKLTMYVKYKSKDLFKTSINTWKFTYERAIWMLRIKTVKKIVNHFC